MNKQSKLVNKKVRERETKIKNALKKIKREVLLRISDIVRMIGLVLLIGVVAGYVFAISVETGKLQVASFWISLMSFAILVISIIRNKLKELVKKFGDVICAILIFAVLVIGTVCMINNFYGDMMSFLISVGCFLISAVIEFAGVTKMVDDGHKEKLNQFEEELEQTKNTSLMS